MLAARVVRAPSATASYPSEAAAKSAIDHAQIYGAPIASGSSQTLLVVPTLSSTLLMSATGKAAGHWRAAELAGLAIFSGLVVDLIVCYWLRGFASDKFWIAWPICSLIVAVVAFVAAVLQKLIGPAGTMVTVIVMILLGNPSSGGATGVPYLPTFWRGLGPYRGNRPDRAGPSPARGHHAR